MPEVSSLHMEQKESKSDSDEDVCLGFKEGNAVMKKPPLKKTILVKVDPKSGDKYIDVNGKKIKIVPQKSPINVNKHAGSVSSIRLSQPCIAARDGLKITVQKKSEISHADKTIHAQIQTAVVNSTPKVAAEMHEKGVQTENCSEESACQTGVDLTDGGCQTESSLTDRCVQTEDELAASLDFEPYDLCKIFEDQVQPFILNKEINNVNMGSGPSLLPLQSTYKNPVLVARNKFFEELRAATMPNAEGNLPIHEAVIKDDLIAVKRNITVLRARNETINIENHNHHTPLQLAIIHYSRLDIVKLLLDRGADILYSDDEGNNLLHLAVQYNRTDSLEAMLNFAIKHKMCIDEFNFEGQTPLILSCVYGFYECAELLVKFKCDVNLKDKKSGRTALFHAAEKHDTPMVQLLLDNKADPKIKNFFGTSPHDAMYEIDEIPPVIKSLIFRKNKRKINELMEQASKAEEVNNQPKKTLKTYPKLRKIDQNEIFSKMVKPIK